MMQSRSLTRPVTTFRRESGSARVQRPGRPRDPRSYQAILEATIAVLLEVGYLRFAIEGVAARAGVGKGTIYRHWPSRGALVVEAITSSACETATQGRWSMRSGELPDTGTLRGDLLAFLESVTPTLTEDPAKEVLPGLAADLTRNPDLAETVRARIIDPQRRSLARLIQRAVARGQARENLDVTLLCETLLGPVCYRAYLAAQPVDRAMLVRLVDQLLPAMTPPPERGPRATRSSS
jgi:AcrR family transcriptional regulator